MRLTSQRGVTAFSRSSWEQENTQIFNMTREHTELPICSCTGTTTAKIQQLIANKVHTLEDIINATGATTGCASCEYDVAKFVEQQLSGAEAE